MTITTMRPLFAFSIALSGVCLALPCAAQRIAPWDRPLPAQTAPLRAPPPPRRLPPPPPLPREREERPHPTRTWYGSYTLAVVGSSLLVGLGTSFAGAPQVGIPLTLGGLVLGGPIVHWAHGEGNRGFLALGVNVGGILVGGLSGWGILCAASRCDRGFDGLVAFLAGGSIGGAAGLIAAVIVDVAALSYQENPRSSSRARYTILPDLQVANDRTTVGLVGTF
jgi:hypothetical protein